MSYEYNRTWNVRGSGFDDVEWGLIISEASKIIEAFEGDLMGAFGEGEPTLNAFEISFMGDPGLDPFIFSRYSNFSSCDTDGLPYDDVVVSILALCKKVSSDKIEIPWFLDNSPLFRKLSAWENLPKGWDEGSLKKYWKTLKEKAPKHPITKCMEDMKGKVDDPGAFCGSLGDKADSGWRSRTSSKKRTSAWDKLPKGWTEESVKKFWDSLTKKSPKHPVTRCIKQMGDKMDNPGAFCGSLADKADPGWRSRNRG